MKQILGYAILLSISFAALASHAETFAEIDALPSGDIKLTIAGPLAFDMMAQGGAIDMTKMLGLKRNIGLFNCEVRSDFAGEPDSGGMFRCSRILFSGKLHAGGDPCCIINDQDKKLAISEVKAQRSGDDLIVYLGRETASVLNDMPQAVRTVSNGVTSTEIGGFTCMREPTMMNIPLLDRILPTEFLYSDWCSIAIPSSNL